MSDIAPGPEDAGEDGLRKAWAKLRALPRDDQREDLLDRGLGILLFLRAGEITTADAVPMLRALLNRNRPEA
ncbi:hypothetical protein [Paractinoplanes deccanensis]|nr:hypothetical protein [Actinoplanes deccanensis]